MAHNSGGLTISIGACRAIRVGLAGLCVVGLGIFPDEPILPRPLQLFLKRTVVRHDLTRVMIATARDLMADAPDFTYCFVSHLRRLPQHS